MRVTSSIGAVGFFAGVTGSAMFLAHVFNALTYPPGLYEQVWLQQLFLVLALAGPISLWGGFQIYKLTIAMDRLRDTANHDGMTRLLTRMRFFALCSAHPGRFGHVLMVDIDHFKRINDGWGHAAGDVVIVHVASILTQLVRREDCVARYGGEEFAVFLKDADKEEAMGIAERIRSAIASMAPPDPGLPCVTVSIGVAPLSCDCAMAEALWRADSALYAAKNEGRNRVRHWFSAPPLRAPVQEGLTLIA